MKNRNSFLIELIVGLVVAAIMSYAEYYYGTISSFFRLIGSGFKSLWSAWSSFKLDPNTALAAHIVISVIVFLVSFFFTAYIVFCILRFSNRAKIRRQFKHSYNLMAKNMLPSMKDMVEKNEPEKNSSIDKYIQSPLEFVNEIVQGNQVPSFNPDDVYQDVLYDECEIKYIVAITAENPNLFLDPTIGFYMSNCYAASLIRHVNDYFKNAEVPSDCIPHLQVQNNNYRRKVNARMNNIIKQLKAGSISDGFEFVRFFIYTEEQEECCRKAILPSLKASQDLFRTFSFFIQKDTLQDGLKEDGWRRFQANNKTIWELYNDFTKSYPDATAVKDRRIGDTVPEFLFIFYEKMIGIHTYLAGHYWPIAIWFADDPVDQAMNDKYLDNVISGGDATQVADSIKNLITALATHVSKDTKKGQLGLADDEKNKNNTFIDWKWVPKNTDPASPAPTEKPVAGS